MNMPTSVIVSFTAVALFDLLFPLLLVFWVRHRFHSHWRSFLVGVAAFAISQAMIRMPLVSVLGAALQDDLQSSATLRTIWLIGLSFSAGLFEETGRYLGFRFFLRNFRSWAEGIMFGLGHGGFEAVFIGGLALINVLAAAYTPLDSLPSESAEQIRAAQATIAALTPWQVMAGGYERVWAIAMHVALSLLVLRTVQGKGTRWFWLAIVTHGLFNFTAVSINQRWGIFAAEASVTLVGLISVAWIIHEYRRSQAQHSVALPAHAPS
jgi:uncharacterized membrane protein YhfC